MLPGCEATHGGFHSARRSIGVSMVRLGRAGLPGCDARHEYFQGASGFFPWCEAKHRGFHGARL